MVTLKPSKGLAGDRMVYAGDVSAEGAAELNQLKPLLYLEHHPSTRSASIKDGATGEVIMLLVREHNDYPWHSGDNYRCSVGGATEVRLYANGRPVGVQFVKDRLFAALSSQIDGSERPTLGPSMVELQKSKNGNSFVFTAKKREGEPGEEVGTYLGVKSSAVLRLRGTTGVDPIVLIVLSWFSVKAHVGGVKGEIGHAPAGPETLHD
eukprot:SM000123S25846  [mRNA]  locus=s123:232668:233996:- [translate_table: standard]